MTNLAPRKRDLPTLAGEIRREHEAVEAGIQATVGAAIRCGELLAEAKSKIQHGDWYSWLEANFPSTPKTAAAYMRLAANRDQIEHAGSIRGALKQLAAPAGSSINQDAQSDMLHTEAPPTRRRRGTPERPAHYFPDVVADDAHENLRTQALHWFEQGLVVRELLDKKRPLEPRSAEDRKAIKREATVMERVARRIKERC